MKLASCYIIREQYQDDDFYVQEDRPPPHSALTVRAILSERFPNRWIGRRCTIDRPTRSPELTRMDFWGAL